MIPDLKDCTLEQKQQFYFNASHCPYCREETVFVDSIEVYRESYGMIHLCRPCKAWVNVHTGSDQAYGFVAKKELRDLRHAAHGYFDPLWQKKAAQGTKRKVAQAKAREWLAKELGIDIVECHMGMFDNKQCLKVIELCKPYYLTSEQVENKKWLLKYKIDLIKSYSHEFNFQVKEFTLMGNTQMELTHQNGKIFYYNVQKKEGRWSNKKKPSPIEDIEQFILNNFKP